MEAISVLTTCVVKKAEGQFLIQIKHEISAKVKILNRDFQFKQ